MTAKEDIRHHARLFDWKCHHERQADTFVHGSSMVTVDYRRDGSVDQANRYEFYKVTNPELQESTGPRHKWSRVVAWLVNY